MEQLILSPKIEKVEPAKYVNPTMRKNLCQACNDFL